MSTKKLLKESDIRRFMKLAAIGPLTENFFVEDVEDEDPDVEEVPEIEPEPEVVEPEGGEEEFGGEEAAVGEAQIDISEEDAETLMSALGDALSDVTGLSVQVVGGEGEEGPEEEVPEVGLEPGEEEAPEAEEGDLEAALEEADISVEEDVSVENIVNEVTMRVAKRLLAESKKKIR